MKAIGNSSDRHARALIFGVASILLGLAICAPILATQGNTELYALFSSVCHQASERCFCIAERPIALCARCVGIYSGVMLAALLFPEKWLSRKTLLMLLSIATSVVALDVGLEMIGLYHNVKWLRLLTGFMLGIALAPFALVALIEMCSKKPSEQRHTKSLS
ncbi:MAG: DUF2085 domain-containing protein [Candidatus Thermochlorobacter sp.]